MLRLGPFILIAVVAVSIVACEGYVQPGTPSPRPATTSAVLTSMPTAELTPVRTLLPAPEPSSQPTTRADALLLEYSREGGIAGFCDHIQVFADATVLYSAECRGAEIKAVNNDRRMQELIDWAASVHTFEKRTEDNPNGPDNLVRELKFFGRGDSEVSPEQLNALTQFAGDLVTLYSAQVKPGVIPTPTKLPVPSLGVIVFAREGNRTFGHDLETGKEWPVTEAMSDFDWSKGGRHAVMIDARESDPTGTIWSVNLDGSGLRQLTSGTSYSHPRWSPDGQEIVFERNARLDSNRKTIVSAEIWIMGADGENPHKLADGFDPAWSPEGKRIAYATNPEVFQQDQGYSQNGIGIMNAAGGDKWMPVSTHTVSEKFTPKEWTMAQARLLDQPQWSPDGSEITFRALGANSAYVTTDASGGGIRQFVALFFDDLPRKFSYSPNGSYVTIGSGGLSGVETLNIYTRGATGRDGYSAERAILTLGYKPRTAAELPLNVDGFAWSPDGSAISYALSSSDSASGYVSKGIYIVNVGGSDNKQIIPDGGAPIFWVP